MMDHSSSEVETDSPRTEEDTAVPESVESESDPAGSSNAAAPEAGAEAEKTEPESLEPLDQQDLDAWARDALPQWLGSLAEDTRVVMDVIAEASLSMQAKRSLVGGLNYLVKSLDLIDDGIEGLGFLEDALILRLSVARAGSQSELPEPLGRFRKDTAYLAAFLGALAPRMQAFAISQEELTARGRSVQDILDQEESYAAWREELTVWADRYRAPAFTCDASGVVKLRSFLNARLPR